ncbi:hypothetical protein BV394_08585 [Brevirhabdus pacifica]|uniref:Uncharacterized protein n=1 Tax=Brevirhabdus pacifica TaxID=1267768 RepID=A0A1U7DIL5_9RHOB|nr:hypothetical protein [Brevirhabdus pacifica]APX89765.1 hypothetical protein BV394_08585 [Brevirhabdus pacifica]OWU74598.1 hypothetical protein ATO5_13225 [Loktanella sp. 22II-4b]PJJ85540.1 hypothetical protein CLV77_0059 [Brevirhabdus pacifica]
MIRKLFIIPALILGLMIGGLTPAPARANHEISRAILGAAAVGLLIKSYEDKRSREKARARAAAQAASRANHSHTRIPAGAARAGRDDPRQCLRQRWTPDGWVSYKDQKCLRELDRRRQQTHDRAVRHVPRSREKPRECLRKRWTNSGWEEFWSTSCLRDHGYRG